jgi:TonB family protein
VPGPASVLSPNRQVGRNPSDAPTATSLPATVVEEASAQSDRKVLNRVVPSYPSLARSMNLKATVRVDAVVDPSGKVKTLTVRGGHPVLVQAAQRAIYKWKWSPAKQESREEIEVRFDPQ